MSNKEEKKENLKKEKNSHIQKFIKGVEKAGNKLPHPFMIFFILAVTILALSFILSKMGVSVTFMSASRNAAEVTSEKTVEVKNLLEAGYMQDFLSNFVNTYITFAPLGLIMVMMLGIGYLQDTGFFNVLMRKTLLGAPVYMIT